MANGLHTLNQLLLGGGHVEGRGDRSVRLVIPPTRQGYADAQLDDCRDLARSRFRWKPPVRLHLRARASHPSPSGTLGFGFWNDPLTFSIGQAGAARRVPASPRALWFFYGSPPNDLSFTPGLPGHGWRAASLQGPRLPAVLLAPAAAGALLAASLPALRRPVVNATRRAVRAAEALLTASLDAWHTYQLEWHRCEATFRVDGQVVLVVDHPPAGPLGFVAWIDNQYAAASPDSGFGFGLLPTDEAQWLEVEEFHLESH